MTHEEFSKQLPDLVNSYQPSPKALGHISNVDLLIFIGPTGVGKTVIIKALGIPYVCPVTTRQPRPEEIDGIDYVFLNDYDQVVADIKDGKFVQVAVGPAGDFYGTLTSSYPEIGLAAMAVVADVMPTFRNLGFNSTESLFITPPTYKEWTNRLNRHILDISQLSKRLVEAKRSLQFALNDHEVHFILNDEIDMAITQIKGVLTGRTDKEREEIAKQAAQEILNAIK